MIQVNLLNKVLGIVAGVLLIDHDVRATDFQQVPYHRIFIMLFLELNAPDQILETINFQVLTAYSNMLNILRPAKVGRTKILIKISTLTVFRLPDLPTPGWRLSLTVSSSDGSCL